MKKLGKFFHKNRNLLRGAAFILLGVGIANFGWSVGAAGLILCIVGFVFLWLDRKSRKPKKK